MGHIWSWNHYFKIFLWNCLWNFSEIVHDHRYLRMVNVTVLDFYVKFILCPRWGSGSFLGLNSTFFNFFSNLFLRFFWNFLMAGSKKLFKVVVLDFQEKVLSMSKMVKWMILLPKINKSILFSLNLFIIFFSKLYLMKGIGRVGKSDCFGYLR